MSYKTLQLCPGCRFCKEQGSRLLTLNNQSYDFIEKSNIDTRT